MRFIWRAAALAAMTALLWSAHAQQPVRIGSTLALTGPLGSAGNIQKVAIEVYIDDLNSRGGLLGRKVEWVLKDDQSRPDLARTLYEQLATVDKVDLIMGPYATANILSAMGVAQRYNKLLIHHTFGTPSLAKYDMQFPAGGLAGDPDNTIPKLVFDALAASGKPPKSVRSEERRVGKECRSRWGPGQRKKRVREMCQGRELEQ